MVTLTIPQGTNFVNANRNWADILSVFTKTKPQFSVILNKECRGYGANRIIAPKVYHFLLKTATIFGDYRRLGIVGAINFQGNIYIMYTIFA
jgi:hypothetical protein